MTQMMVMIAGFEGSAAVLSTSKESGGSIGFAMKKQESVEIEDASVTAFIKNSIWEYIEVTFYGFLED